MHCFDQNEDKRTEAADMITPLESLCLPRKQHPTEGRGGRKRIRVRKGVAGSLGAGAGHKCKNPRIAS